MRKSCKDCIYHKIICYVGGSTYGCTYILETGKKRVDNPQFCTKKKIKENKKKHGQDIY